MLLSVYCNMLWAGGGWGVGYLGRFQVYSDDFNSHWRNLFIFSSKLH